MNWRQYRLLEKNEFLLFSVDTASGGGDYTTCQVLSKTKIDVPLVFQSRATTSDFIPELVRVLEAVFKYTGVKPVVSLERNNGGSFLIEQVAKLNFSGNYEVFRMPKFGGIENAEASLYGWSTNTATRPKMLQELKDVIEKKIIKIYDRQTINEMLSFIVVQTSSSWKGTAEIGSHDDLVMALAIAWQMYQICDPARANKNYDKYENYKQDSYEDKGLRI